MLGHIHDPSKNVKPCLDVLGFCLESLCLRAFLWQQEWMTCDTGASIRKATSYHLCLVCASACSIIPLMAKFASMNMQAKAQPLSLQLDSYKGAFCGTGAVPLFMFYKFSKLLFLAMIQKAYQTKIELNYIKLVCLLAF